MVNWHETPFVRIVFALILGILLAQYFVLNTWLILSLAATAAISFFFFQKDFNYHWRWLSGIFISIFFTLLGVFLVHFHDASKKEDFFAKFLQQKKEANIIGLVSELPEDGKNKKITIKVLSINDTSATGNILLYTKPSTLANGIDYGDIISFKGYVNPVRASKNPETFDFQNYMKHHNVFHLCYVNEENLSIIANERGNPILHFAYKTQEALLGVLAQYIPENEEFSVASALVIGYRSKIPDEVIQAYVNTGALHVLSVSGLHVGLVSVVMNWVLKKIRSRSKAKFWKWLDPLLQISFVWIFSLVTGAAPCVLRAAVMFTFVIIGKASSNTSNIYNMLGASCFTLLVWNPDYLYDVGFQLSYLGLLGIVYFQPKIYAFGLNCVNRYDFLWNIYHFKIFNFNPKNKYLSKIFNFNWIDHCWQLTSVSLAATIAVSPLSIFYFHQFPTYFWLSGLIVVPLSAAALYISIGLFIACKINFVAVGIGKILWATIWLLNHSLYWIEMIPPGAIKHLWLSGIACVLIYFALFFAVTTINTRQLKWFSFGTLTFLLLVSLRYNYNDLQLQKQQEIIIYNTGFYTLIDCFNGKKSYSIGSKDIPERVVNFSAYNYRLSKGILPDDVNFISLNDSTQNEQFFYKNHLLCFADKKISIIDQRPTPISQKLKVDYILIRDNPTLSIDDIKAAFDFDKILFDASNKKNKVERWKTDCTTKNISFQDISENYLRISF